MQMLVLERLWISSFTVYANPRKEANHTMGENVGINLAVRAASTNRGTLLFKLSRYFFRMERNARNNITKATVQEKRDHEVKGPVSWLHFQHMRYAYAQGAQGEIIRIARQAALRKQERKERVNIEREIRKEKSKVRKGESELGEAESDFYSFMSGYESDEQADSDPFMGAPGIGSLAKSDDSPLVGGKLPSSVELSYQRPLCLVRRNAMGKMESIPDALRKSRGGPAVESVVGQIPNWQLTAPTEKGINSQGSQGIGIVGGALEGTTNTQASSQVSRGGNELGDRNAPEISVDAQSMASIVNAQNGLVGPVNDPSSHIALPEQLTQHAQGQRTMPVEDSSMGGTESGAGDADQGGVTTKCVHQ